MTLPLIGFIYSPLQVRKGARVWVWWLQHWRELMSRLWEHRFETILPGLSIANVCIERKIVLQWFVICFGRRPAWILNEETFINPFPHSVVHIFWVIWEYWQGTRPEHLAYLQNVTFLKQRQQWYCATILPIDEMTMEIIEMLSIDCISECWFKNSWTHTAKFPRHPAIKLEVSTRPKGLEGKVGLMMCWAGLFWKDKKNGLVSEDSWMGSLMIWISGKVGPRAGLG